MTSDRFSRGFRRLGDNELARLTFHGAARQVTGSCYLLETRETRVLVECGMHQGSRKEEALNRQPFPFDPRGLDAALLTHAHIDHSGLLPKLVRDGFDGEVHATRATAGLARIMLPDSAAIQEQDAEHASRRLVRSGRKPVEPAYTQEDAEKALRRFVGHPYDERWRLSEDVEVRFRLAGHILGAASIEVWVRWETGERKVVFSGDVGRNLDPLLRDPAEIDEADLVLLESTYGDRDHRAQDDSLEEFADVFRQADRSGGNVIVPVFAVGRAQEVLYYLGKFEQEGRIPKRPVYLDSPMAIEVTRLYVQHPECFEEKLLQSIRDGAEPPTPSVLRYTREADQSRAINEKQGVTILSASGMCDAGRIVHHLRHNLWRHEAHVAIVGYQAVGTRGRALVDGARRVRIFGEPVAVNATVHTLGGFSAHAGQSELVRWMRPFGDPPPPVALVHGEPEKQEALAQLLRRNPQARVFIPEKGRSCVLQRRGAPVEFA